MSVENTETFGNYLIHGIDEIVLPEAITWWPSAPGWKVLGLILLAWLVLRVVRLARHWWRNRYRRQALQQLKQLQQQVGSKALGSLPRAIDGQDRRTMIVRQAAAVQVAPAVALKRRAEYEGWPP